MIPAPTGTEGAGYPGGAGAAAGAEAPWAP